MRQFLIPALLVFSGTACAQDAPSLDWMTGHWRSAEGGQASEEIWTDGAGGLYLGVNRTIAGDHARGFEFLRIEMRADGPAYCAQPGGGPAACFTLESQGDGWAVFENPEHDFPQRIRYDREGGTLTATVSDLSEEQSLAFRWERVGD